MPGARIRWDEKSPSPDNASRHLPELAQAWFEQGRAAAKDDATPKALHAFRLRTKRLRYTLEMFRPLYGPRLDKCLAGMRKVQQALGSINDCTTARTLLLDRAAGPQRAKIERFLDQRTAALTAAFRKTWSEVDTPGEDARWRGYLARKRAT